MFDFETLDDFIEYCAAFHPERHEQVAIYFMWKAEQSRQIGFCDLAERQMNDADRYFNNG